MKKITLLASFTFFSFLNLNAQCIKTATDFGNNTSTTMYNVSGSVKVILNSLTSISVNLGSDFSTASGPDVRIFLVNRGTLTDSQLKTPTIFNSRPKIEMAMNPSISSTYTKTIPPGLNISDFDTVYFYCQQFNQFWDFGSFEPFTIANCSSVLTNNAFEINNLKIFPNPVLNELNIEHADNLKIKIYNVVGNNLFNSNLDTINKIDLSNFNSGIYFIEFTDKNKNRLVKQFIKQ